MPIYHEFNVTSKTAKEEFFLTPADLRELPRDTGGGWGCGGARFYRLDDLKAAALRKYGEEGLKRKREAKKERVRTAGSKADSLTVHVT
jgi:hypothetical protein